jgi:metal-responsive CopG/Arc/MetJ family transcriptional regulator
VKKSRIRRLIRKKLAREITKAKGDARSALETVADREASPIVDKMLAKGYQLVTRLESGEGVFVREYDQISLHVQLPGALYKRLNTAVQERETTKRDVVIAALEAYLGD